MKYLSENQNLVNWLRVMRVSQGFFFISAMPVVLGVLMLKFNYPEIQINTFVAFLILIGSLLYHLSADMTNEYYDHISGNDALVDVKTPFSGGTGILEEGLIAPKRVLNMAYLFFFIGIIISILIAYLTNWYVLLFSLLGIISCWGYTAPPLKFCYRGFGEIVIFLNNGLFVIGAIYIAFLEKLAWNMVLPACTLGFLGMAIILMNEIPDLSADRQVDKKNLVVRFGIKTALKIQKFAMLSSMLCLIGAVAFKVLPLYCLIGLVAPFTMKEKNIFTIKDAPEKDAAALTGLCKTTIDLKFRTWGLTCLGFVPYYLFH